MKVIVAAPVSSRADTDAASEFNGGQLASRHRAWHSSLSAANEDDQCQENTNESYLKQRGTLHRVVLNRCLPIDLLLSLIQI